MGQVTGFFDESREQSLIKATIVEKYFDSWAGIITATQNRPGYRGDKRIGYVDLFAGPGRYKSGADSTPLRVLQKAISNADYAGRLVSVFNDKDEENVQSLRKAIAELPGIENLKSPPDVWNEEVGDRIAAEYEGVKTIPLLAFIDPWGYKGLSLRLVNSFLKSWACDCIFFFNYSRINAGLSNPKVREHMCALFGEERADRLRTELEPLSPAEREAKIVNELAQAFKEYGDRYVLPFCFKNAKGNRTSHHLILVTKHFKGYDVMKGIMARCSSSNEEGVPSFTYTPPAGLRQGLLFELNRPLKQLGEMLVADFAGRTLTMREIYEQHSVDRPFLASSYKDVLQMLEVEGRITADPPATERRRGTFADRTNVTFPRR